jgi:hypothetical protein
MPSDKLTEHSRRLHIEESIMPAPYAFRSNRPGRLPLVLAGMTLLVVACGLTAPAAAQIMIGIGMGDGGGGGFGLGGGGMMSGPQNASPAPSDSSTEHRSHKAKSAKSDSDKKRVKEAKSRSGGDTSAPSKAVDETSFPAR